MSDQRGGATTEAATPKRLADARARGQVAQSTAFTSACAFAAVAGALLVGAPWLLVEGMRVMEQGLARAVAGSAEPTVAFAALTQASHDVLRLSLPVLVPGFIVAVIVGALQAGGLFTLRPLLPDGRRVDPLAGWTRIFSARTAFELCRSLAALATVLVIAWLTLAPLVVELPRLAGARPGVLLTFAGLIAAKLLLRVAVALALLGALDALWQRRQHFKDLRMSRAEVRREQLDSEGEPHRKAARRRQHRELVEHGTREAVRRADCMIVNSEHLAIALRFDAASMAAPEIVAKGERLVAQQLQSLARRYGVPIYCDVPLARMLARLEPGDELPEELYDAVAEVLRFVGRGAAPREELA